VGRKVHELSDNLEIKLRALTVLVSTQGNEKEASALNRLKDTVRSAATVLSAASTTIDASETSAGNVYSNASVMSWEPDENFNQWMATVVDFTTVDPIQVESRLESNTAASAVMSLPQPQDPSLQSHHAVPVTITQTNSNTRIPAITMIAASDVQHEEDNTEDHTTLTGQERASLSLPSHSGDDIRAVTVLPDHTEQSHLGSRLYSHVRSSSAPGAILSTASLASPKTEKNKFWKRSRPRSQVNVVEPQAGLKVHEPRSSASLSATAAASEDNDDFRLVELYSNARCSMNMARIPAPTRKGGKTCVKAVYVGDGACGKTCSLMCVCEPYKTDNLTTTLTSSSSFSRGSFPQVSFADTAICTS
jgi:hypothetical protein